MKKSVNEIHEQMDKFAEEFLGFLETRTTDWLCGGTSFPIAIGVMKRQGWTENQINATIKCFKEEQAYCDCEIAHNVFCDNEVKLSMKKDNNCFHHININESETQEVSRKDLKIVCKHCHDDLHKEVPTKYSKLFLQKS